MSADHNITIPQPSEYDRLLVVWEDSVRVTHDFVSEEKIAVLKAIIQEQQLFHRSSVFCVRDTQGIVTGFAGTSGDSLDMLFLHPSIIGSGAGKILMRHAIRVKGITRVDVNEQNLHALAFYRHFGFEVTGRSETDEYGQPFPMLHMRLNPAYPCPV